MFKATEKFITETIVDLVTGPPARALLQGVVRGLGQGCCAAETFLRAQVEFDLAAQHAQLTRRRGFLGGRETPVEKLEATIEALKERQRELELEGEIRRLQKTIAWQEREQAPDAAYTEPATAA